MKSVDRPLITLITRKKAQAQRRAISAIKKSVLIRVIRGPSTNYTNYTKKKLKHSAEQLVQIKKSVLICVIRGQKTLWTKNSTDKKIIH